MLGVCLPPSRKDVIIQCLESEFQASTIASYNRGLYFSGFCFGFLVETIYSRLNKDTMNGYGLINQLAAYRL